MRYLHSIAALLMLGGVVLAQQSTPATPKPPGTPAAQGGAATTVKKPTPKACVGKLSGMPCRAECSEEGGFCVNVPASWKRLGDVFDGLGFVVAQPDSKTPEDAWTQITVTVLPFDEEDEQAEPPTVDQVVDMMLENPREGTEMQTLQRASEVLGGRQAQTTRVRLTTDAGVKVEQVAVLQTENEIYSLAVSSPEADVEKLAPILRDAAASLREKPMAPEKRQAPAPQAQPKPHSETPAQTPHSPATTPKSH